MCKFKTPKTLKCAIKQTLTLHQHALMKGITYKAAKAKWTESPKEIYNPLGDCPLCAFNRTDVGTVNCSTCPWTMFEDTLCVLENYSNSKQAIIRLSGWLTRLKAEEES